MPFTHFVERINALAVKASYPGKITFSEEDGRYEARFDDGLIIRGNSVSARIAVQWGSGHQAFA